MEDGHFSRKAAHITGAKRSRNEARRRAGGAATIALLAAIMAGILALTAALAQCGRLDPAASSLEPIRTIDATAVRTRQFMAL